MGEENLKSAPADIMHLNLMTFEAVKKVKSIRRAIRRGNVASFGVSYPKRPFNNRKNKSLEDLKRKIYNGIKQARTRAAEVA
jgi:hypothetical protein